MVKQKKQIIYHLFYHLSKNDIIMVSCKLAIGSWSIVVEIGYHVAQVLEDVIHEMGVENVLQVIVFLIVFLYTTL